VASGWESGVGRREVEGRRGEAGGLAREGLGRGAGEQESRGAGDCEGGRVLTGPATRRVSCSPHLPLSP
jgi:hypothetical protein